MRLVLFAASAAALVACHAVPSPETVDRHNTAAHDAALARAQRSFGGAPFAPAMVMVDDDRPGPPSPQLDAPPPPPPPAPLAVHAAGQGDADTLYQLAASIGFAGPTCGLGDSCGCDAPIGYAFLQRPDGKVAVVRLAPDVHTYEREVASCGYGCGQPAPPPPRVAYDLGVTDPAAIQIIDEHYRFERVVETCDNPIPRP